MSGTLVICTRNRPDDLARTLASVDAQAVSFPLDILVIDAGDPEPAQAVASICRQPYQFPVRHIHFTDTPSLARQRNLALDLLAPETDVVFFTDDDISLDAGYLEYLWQVFVDRPDVVGTGGRVRASEPAPGDSMVASLYRTLFLMECPTPGGVFPSGGESQAYLRDLRERTAVHWLSGCSCAYRPAPARQIRFDDRLEGYSLDEDLDFSFRMGQIGALIVEPHASLVHHRSSRNRHQKRRYAAEYLVHRYWFVEKNIRHPLRKPAFWWASIGRMGRTLFSRDPHASDTRKGLVDGARIILHRADPLLRHSVPG
jgi:glycosyltransferase involved in cell wall biosynthesis